LFVRGRNLQSLLAGQEVTPIYTFGQFIKVGRSRRNSNQLKGLLTASFVPDIQSVTEALNNRIKDGIKARRELL